MEELFGYERESYGKKMIVLDQAYGEITKAEECYIREILDRRAEIIPSNIRNDILFDLKHIKINISRYQDKAR